MKKIKITRNNTKRPKSPKGKKSWGKIILTWALFIGIGIVSLCLAFALYIIIASPDFDTKKLYNKNATVIYDKNLDEIARIGDENRELIYYDDLPEVLIDALVATEDSRYYQHNGVDILRFIKASIGQLTGNSNAGGASTISMQVIKNTYTSKEASGIKGIIRKFTDVYMAVFKLEAKYTKEEIMEFYFNSQWLGYDGNLNYTGIYGIEQASKYYFGKSVKDLTLAESSMLVGMFQNPILYNPFKNPEGCYNRQNTVLTLMVKHGYITESQKEEVQKIPISSLLTTHKTKNDNSNQAYIDYVLDDVKEKMNIDPYQSVLEIYTNFDPAIQKNLVNVENGEAYAFPNDVMQVGIAVTDVNDGSVVALSGGRNYQAKGLNRATDISRQPGSTAKPLVDYAMYIENISHSTYAMFLDEPTTYSNGAPISDYDNSYKGLITMRYALQDSRNIPALHAFQAVADIDQKIIEDFVHSIGIDYGEELYESASIGGFNGVSPLELSAAYAVFGRGGYYIEPYSFTKIVDVETGKEYKHNYKKTQVMEETTAYLVNNILIGVYGGKGVSGTQIGGKTGTTNLDSDTKKKYGLPGGAISDSWIVSYSKDYSISVWLGYDALNSKNEEGKPYYLTSSVGGTARRQIMNYLATNTYKKNAKFNTPSGITTARIELQSFPAQLCSDFTPANMCITEYFVSGTEPTESSSRYSKLAAPTNGSGTASNGQVTLKWDSVETPDAVNSGSLSDHFNEYYSDHAQKYYNNRVNYNNSNIGAFGYDIYLRYNGNETYLGFTSSNTFNYNTNLTGDLDFIVKSSYSIFKGNQSDGLAIRVKVADANPTTPPKTEKPKPDSGNTDNNPDDNNDNNDTPSNDDENLD